jgi:hypothetical protein
VPTVRSPAPEERVKLLDVLSEQRGKLTREIATIFSTPARATRTRWALLMGTGLLREVGTEPQDSKRRHFATIPQR